MNVGMDVSTVDFRRYLHPPSSYFLGFENVFYHSEAANSQNREQQHTDVLKIQFSCSNASASTIQNLNPLLRYHI